MRLDERRQGGGAYDVTITSALFVPWIAGVGVGAGRPRWSWGGLGRARSRPTSGDFRCVRGCVPRAQCLPALEISVHVVSRVFQFQKKTIQTLHQTFV